MSTGHGRLCEAVDKAQPLAPDETVEVLAMDIAETLADYRRMALEISDLRAANRDSVAHFEQLREEHTAFAHEIIDLRNALKIARSGKETCKCDGSDMSLSEIDAFVKPNTAVSDRRAR